MQPLRRQIGKSKRRPAIVRGEEEGQGTGSTLLRLSKRQLFYDGREVSRRDKEIAAPNWSENLTKLDRGQKRRWAKTWPHPCEKAIVRRPRIKPLNITTGKTEDVGHAPTGEKRASKRCQWVSEYRQHRTKAGTDTERKERGARGNRRLLLRKDAATVWARRDLFGRKAGGAGTQTPQRKRKYFSMMLGRKCEERETSWRLMAHLGLSTGDSKVENNLHLPHLGPSAGFKRSLEG